MSNAATILDSLTARYPDLNGIRDDIWAVYEILRDCYENGGKVLI